MKKEWLVKTLALGVVVLFICVSIHPAFAIDTKKSIIVNQSDECSDCRELNNAELVKVDRLLNKVEVYSKLFLVLSKYTPEIKEEIEELSDKISTLKEELADETTLPTICVILEVIHEILKGLYCFFEELAYAIEPRFYIASLLASICSETVQIIKFNIFFIGHLLSCWEWPGPPTGTLIVKILDTRGGLPQSGVTIEIKNGTYGKLTTTFGNGKVYFFFTPYQDWDIYVNFIYAGTVEFYQPKLVVIYYLDEILDSRIGIGI